jgi:hypothetical protein
LIVADETRGFEMSEDTFDPKVCFDSRKSILKAVKSSQLQEHAILKRINQVTIRHKRELLILISNWLSIQTNITGSYDQIEMEEISDVSLLEWVNLQQKYLETRQMADIAQKDESVCRRKLNETAPFSLVTDRMSVINRIFATEEEKSRIDQLNLELKSKTIRREQLEQQLINVNLDREKLSEIFLRNCMANINNLMRSKTMGNEVEAIMNRWTTGVSNLWIEHVLSQQEVIKHIEMSLDSLRKNYEIEKNKMLRSKNG